MFTRFVWTGHPLLQWKQDIVHLDSTTSACKHLEPNPSPSKCAPNEKYKHMISFSPPPPAVSLLSHGTPAAPLPSTSVPPSPPFPMAATPPAARDQHGAARRPAPCGGPAPCAVRADRHGRGGVGGQGGDHLAPWRMVSGGSWSNCGSDPHSFVTSQCKLMLTLYKKELICGSVRLHVPISYQNFRKHPLKVYRSLIAAKLLQGLGCNKTRQCPRPRIGLQSRPLET